METRYLKTLTAVVDCGSFSKASEILHITQSAVSQRIKFLEDHFGQQLLDRSGPKLTLTATGRTVLQKARQILDMEQALFNALQESEERKHLSLCCTPTFGMAFLPQVLNDFIRRHADMNDLKFIFMQPQQALQGLRNGEYQLAVVEHPLEYGFTGLRRYALPDDEMLFVISPLHNIVPEEETLLSDLQTLFPLRLFARRDGCSSKEVLRQNLKFVGADFDNFAGLVISDDLRLTIQSVLVGTGVAYLSRDLVADYLQSGQMMALKVRGFDHRRGRSVVLPQLSDHNPLLDSFLDCLFRVVSPDWQPQANIEEEGKMTVLPCNAAGQAD